MKKRLIYLPPVAITEIVTDEDILTLSGPDPDPDAEPVIIQATGWKN